MAFTISKPPTANLTHVRRSGILDPFVRGIPLRWLALLSIVPDGFRHAGSFW
jgi:hypothetical protein